MDDMAYGFCDAISSLDDNFWVKSTNQPDFLVAINANIVEQIGANVFNLVSSNQHPYRNQPKCELQKQILFRMIPINIIKEVSVRAFMFVFSREMAAAFITGNNGRFCAITSMICE